jgi:hypothetical protein
MMKASTKFTASDAYLAYDRVPQPIWSGLSSGQQDLHLLWRKKLIPAFEDDSRVKPDVVSHTERQMIVAALQGVSDRNLPFAYEGACTVGRRQLHFLHGTVAAQAVLPDLEGDGQLEIRLTVVTADSCPEEQRIAMGLRADSIELDVVIEWQPAHDPARGSVYLYPQAAGSGLRFGIAALNHEQFNSVCRAFIAYCSTSMYRQRSQPLAS